jgi:hypothetical protein
MRKMTKMKSALLLALIGMTLSAGCTGSFWMAGLRTAGLYLGLEYFTDNNGVGNWFNNQDVAKSRLGN